MRMLELALPYAPLVVSLSLLAAFGLGLLFDELRRCRREGRSLITGRVKG